MKTTLQFFNASENHFNVEAKIIPIPTETFNLSCLQLPESNYVFQISRNTANIRVSEFDNYQLLAFNAEKRLIQSYEPSDSSILLEQACKWLIAIPNSVENLIDNIQPKTAFKLDYTTTPRKDAQTYMKTHYPIARFPGTGIFITTIRRMQGEHKLQLPISWRTKAPISTETEERANQMNETVWLNFYNAHCIRLKKHYPETYTSIFSE